jgi:hypothetical protein
MNSRTLSDKFLSICAYLRRACDTAGTHAARTGTARTCTARTRTRGSARDEASKGKEHEHTSAVCAETMRRGNAKEGECKTRASTKDAARQKRRARRDQHDQVSLNRVSFTLIKSLVLSKSLSLSSPFVSVLKPGFYQVSLTIKVSLWHTRVRSLPQTYPHTR